MLKRSFPLSFLISATHLALPLRGWFKIPRVHKPLEIKESINETLDSGLSRSIGAARTSPVPQGRAAEEPQGKGCSAYLYLFTLYSLSYTH